MNRDLCIVYPNLQAAQARSNQQALAMGCDGVLTKYWWTAETLSGRAAMLVIEPDTPPFDATYLTANELSSLRSVSQMTAPGYNACSYGAIGNGKSNPAAGFYPTLAELQKDYPFATTITNEMDWLGIESAKAAAEASPCGGYVYLPAGKYICDQLISPFPSVYEITAGAVSMMGDGSGATFITFPNDIQGPPNSQFAVSCASRTTAASQGFFRGFTVIGPAARITPGVAPCNLSGIGWGARRQMEDIGISGFYACLAISGDQTLFSSLYISGGFYGIYFDIQNPTLFGDLQFNKCKVVSCAMAAVAVAHTLTIGHTLWNACILGSSPFSIFKETNDGAPGQVQVLNGATFINVQFENFGNAAISDDRTSATRVAYINSSEFIKCEWSWLPSVKIATLESAAVIDVKQALYSNIRGFLEPDLMTPGTLGVFNLAFGWGYGIIEGDIDSLIGVCNAAQLPLFSNASGNTHCRIRSIDWEGIIVTTSVPLSIGNYMIADVSGCVVCNGNANDAPMGVIKAFWSGFTRAILATAGHGSQVLSGSAPAGGVVVGQFLRTGPSGSLVVASGASDLTSPIVGRSAGTFAAGAAWSIVLRPWEN